MAVGVSRGRDPATGAGVANADLFSEKMQGKNNQFKNGKRETKSIKVQVNQEEEKEEDRSTFLKLRFHPQVAVVEYLLTEQEREEKREAHRLINKRKESNRRARSCERQQRCLTLRQQQLQQQQMIQGKSYHGGNVPIKFDFYSPGLVASGCKEISPWAVGSVSGRGTGVRHLLTKQQESCISSSTKHRQTPSITAWEFFLASFLFLKLMTSLIVSSVVHDKTRKIKSFRRASISSL